MPSTDTWRENSAQQLALLDEAGPSECKYPAVLPSTAYRYGCRCTGCVAAKTQTPGAFGPCEVDGCATQRTARRRRCVEHDALCRADGCTKPRRQVQAAMHCEEHSTSVAYELRPAARHERTCDMCECTYTPKVASNSALLRLCPDCRTKHGAAIKAWRRHSVDWDVIRRWLTDPRCWICEQPIAVVVGFGQQTHASTAVVDHDHRCCPGSTGCEQCVRGLAHTNCNLQLGHVEKALRTLGRSRLDAVLDRLEADAT